MQRLRGRVAIVTGAAGCVGGALALGMAREGAVVILADRDKEQLYTVQGEIERLNLKAEAVPTDVTDEKSVDELVTQAHSRFKNIDILINGGSLYFHGSLEDTSEENWDEIIRANLVGTFLCSRAVVPAMLERKSGRIISITAESALEGFRNEAAYSAAKAGVIGFSKALALELAPHQITVNTICYQMHLEDQPHSGLQNGDREFLETGRSGIAGDGAGPAVFLASDAAAYITGQTLFANVKSDTEYAGRERT